MAKSQKDYNLFVNKLINHKTLDKEDKEYISWFAAFQIARTTAFRDKLEKSEDYIRKQLTKFSIHDEQSAENLIQRYREEHPEEEDEMTSSKLFDFIKNENYNVVVPKEYSIRMMLESASELQKTLCKMDMYFLIAKKESAFITSDNPFFLRPPRNTSIWGYGYGTPDLEKTFPLTSKLCLLIGSYGNRVNFIDIDRTKVRHINLRTAKSANRYIMGSVDAILVRVINELQL